MSIHSFPLYKLEDVPEALRLLANKIEHGETDAIRCVVVLEQSDGGAGYRCFGPEPFTRAHAIGLCFATANAIYDETKEEL